MRLSKRIMALCFILFFLETLWLLEDFQVIQLKKLLSSEKLESSISKNQYTESEVKAKAPSPSVPEEESPVPDEVYAYASVRATDNVDNHEVVILTDVTKEATSKGD